MSLPTDLASTHYGGFMSKTTCLLISSLIIFFTLGFTTTAVSENIDQITLQKNTQIAEDIKNRLGPVREPQRDDRGGPDDFGYRWRDNEEENVEYEWINLLEGDYEGQAIRGVGDDSNHGPFDLGWDFPFYGREFDSFRVCSNGWMSFTSQSTFYWVNGEDRDFPHAGNYPENVIAPFMTDLYPADDRDNCIFWFTDPDERIAVVSWIGILSYGQRELSYTFQVIMQGNGRIKMQYMTDQGIDQDHQVIVGIQNANRDIGLTVFRGAGLGAPEDEYAIDISKALGWMTGTVTDLETGDPLENATVTLSDNTEAQTDEEGIYWLNEVLADPYTATASLHGYNPVTSEEFEIADQETLQVDFELPHPEIRVNERLFTKELPQHGVDEDEFTIFNDGNGELEFWMRYTIPVERDDPGDVVFDWAATELTGDDRLRGIATDGENYYLTGSNSRDNPNLVYVINRQGELINQFEQPVEDPSANGMRGLACDGTFLYAADGRDLVQFTTEGEGVAIIPGPMNPVQHVTYDPETDHLWVASTRSSLVCIDREGNVLESINNNMRMYGITWHPEDADGYNLYVFHRVNEGSQTSISKVNVANGDIMHVMDLELGEETRALDFVMTNTFNPLIWLLVTLVEDVVPDRIVAVELELNTSWITTDPMDGTVEPDSDLPVSLRFDAGDWLPGTYELVLVIESNTAGENINIPLTLNVTGEGLEMQFYEFAETERRHNFVIGTCTLRGEPAVWGDEIGIFTPEGMCVGGSIWFEQPTMVPAFGDDPDTDFTEGFFVDDPPAFRVWDEDIDQDFAAEFIHVSGDETFQVDGSKRGMLSVPGQIRELVYELPLGWSLISANILLDEHDIEVIFEDLVENELLEMLKDGWGHFYRPDFHYIDIDGWCEAEGYLIKLRQQASFSLTGESIDPVTPLELAENWNMISYYPRWEMDARVAFEPLGENLVIAKDGNGHFYLPAWDFSDMGNLCEQNGYLVKLVEAADFRYPQAGLMAAESKDIGLPRHLALPSPTSNNMSLLVLTTEWESGTEVALAFESGMICGAGCVDSEGRAGIAIWGDDPGTPEKEGPSPGDELELSVW